MIARDMEALRVKSAAHLPPLSALAHHLNEFRAPEKNRGETNVKSNNKNRKMWLRLAAVAFVITVAGAVFATTQSGAISFWVDTDGKTDKQVEDEIVEQLEESGVEDPKVKFKRDDDGTEVRIKGTRGDHKFKLIRKEEGGDGTVVQMHHEPMDTEREPGMTDDELRDKILAQMEARGMTGDVEIDGDKIRIRAEMEQEVEDGGDEE
jgi:hypothetical protein